MSLSQPLVPKHQLGLTLIELMVSLVLSSFLLLGLMQLFLNSNSADRANTALARLQENGRIALDLLKQDLRRTSYQGCANPMAESRVNSSRTFPIDAVGAPSSDDSPTDDETYEGPGTASDQLVMHHARPITMQPTDISQTSVTVITTTNISFTAGHRYEFILTDCDDVAIFTGVASTLSHNPRTAEPGKPVMPNMYTFSSLQGRNGGTAPSFSGIRTGEDTQLLAVATNRYELRADPSNKGADGNGIMTLYKNGDPMIAHVDNFQVLYGIVDDNGLTSWVNADNLTDEFRSKLNRLQVSLVMSSPDEVADAPNTLALPIANLVTNTKLAAIGDHRLRRVFNSVIDVRNRP